MSPAAQMGAAPSPMKPAPMSAATASTSAKWPFTSSQVWWIVSSGAPDSSSWPPGSRLTLAPSRSSPISLPASSTGVQLKRSRNPSSMAVIDTGPL